MFDKKLTLSALSLCLFASTIGCGEDVETIEVGDDFRVINGAPASSGVAQYAATVALHERFGGQVGPSPFCTGTLITSDVVMTAAHCCDAATNGPNFQTMSPADVAVYFGDGPAVQNGQLVGDLYAVSEVSIHPSYGRYSLQNDICMVRLSVPNDSSPTVPPLPASLGLSNADAGEMLDHVGFGYGDVDKTEFGVKLHAEVPMAGLGCVVAGCSSSGSTGQFSYEQDGSPYWGPCNGDSGGPAFIDRGGQTYVAGITSYGDAYCTLYGVSTNVSAYESFIDGFTGGGGGGGGGGGEPPAGCDNDGVCEAGESCDGRNGTNACGDCAGKTSGKPSKRYCYVEGVCEGPGC